MRLVSGGRRIAIALALLAAPLALLLPPLGAALLAASVAVAAFYRDPDRTVPETGVVAPADGRVTVVREDGQRLRVGVFMNVTDVHVNRAPVGGEIGDVTHEPGGHWPAFSKASERNERLRIEIGETEVTLIAGTLARRTRAYVEPGDSIERGERIGHIALGSRADVLFPPAVDRSDLRVAEGDRVRAGETIIAERPD